MKELNLKDKKSKKQIDNIRDLKIILYDCFEQYEWCEDIINELRNLNTEQVISDEEYDFIMAHYEEWLKEWEERK